MKRCESSFQQQAFTLIELLVVIAIIAILSVVVILTLNPAELLHQSRDSSRIADMATINQALGIYTEDVGGSMGSSSIIYVSIPDPSATSTAGDQCQGLGLLTLPSNYTYHCAFSANNRNTDGTGWIPLNLKNSSFGSIIGSLPVDPINTSSSRLFYTYVTNGTQYEITSGMESKKYGSGGTNDVVGPDGGTKSTLYEKGTNLTLNPLDYGDSSLVAYWPLNEGTSSIAYDDSGNNALGTWNGTPTGTSGYYSIGPSGSYVGTFDGISNYITATVPKVNISANGVNSVTFWMKWSGAADQVIFDIGNFNYWINNTGCAGINSGGSVWGTNAPTANQWVFISLVLYNGNFNTNGSQLYYNGSPATLSGCNGGSAYSAAANSTISIGRWYTGGHSFIGSLYGFHIYNRALSAGEISALYAGGR